MPKGDNAQKGKEGFQPKGWDKEAAIERALELYKKGYSKSRIKMMLYKELGVPLNQFVNINKKVMDTLSEVNDIYNSCGRELQLERLQELMQDAIGNNDGNLALKIIAEINKLMSYYTQNVNMTNNEITFKIKND